MATISLQFYWNIKNYQENKIRLINEVQIALDNSIEYYYGEISKESVLTFINKDSTIGNSEFLKRIKLDTVFKNSKKIKSNIKKDSNQIKTVHPELIKNIHFTSAHIRFNDTINDLAKTNLPAAILDSIQNATPVIWKKSAQKTVAVENALHSISSISVLKGKKASDSIMNLKNLANKIVISMVNDSLEFEKLSAALNKELNRKNIAVDYKLIHYKSDTIFDSFQSKENQLPFTLSNFSKSTYLPKNQKVELLFSNPTLLLLKRSMIEIILSLLLSLSIIGCLLYLLNIINRQKKLDEIKNDLISNITHEFKTPITTVATALEAVKNFNLTNDIEKTNRYLDISGMQLKKLELMVERLLETASLDTDKLTLQKKRTDLIPLLTSQIEKHHLLTANKIVSFTANTETCHHNIDVFHFENTISNLIDNAIKYGGEIIKIDLQQKNNQIEISISDNGIGLDKNQHEKIFEKFYRVPKGNLHDVKGFGIGLYYAKKIIEKHQGYITVISEKMSTTFKVILPNEFKN